MASNPHSYICKDCFGCLSVHVKEEMPGIAFICCYYFWLISGGLATGIFERQALYPEEIRF